MKEVLDSDKLSFSLGGLRFSAYTILSTLVILLSLTTITLLFLKKCEQRIRNIHQLKPSNREILIKTLYFTIITCGFFIALGVMGFDTTVLTVLSGTVGIGIGFGIQKLVLNLITGIVLLFEKSFEIGDLVELNDKSVGFVRQMAARYVLIELFCGKEVIIPNEEFINNKIINWTRKNNNLRFEILIEVSHKENISVVKGIILDAVNRSIYSLKEPKPFCILQDIRDGIMRFSLFFWVENVKNGFSVPQGEIRSEIWQALQSNGVFIPVPIRKNISI